MSLSPRAPLPRSLRRVIDRYVLAFAPERIVLFGSYAKGSDHQRSDVDLLIVADVRDDARDARRLASHLAADSFPPVDVVFASPDEVARAHGTDDVFLRSILDTGVIVYSRDGPDARVWS